MSAERAALDDVPCGVLTTRGDGTVIQANRVLCGWLGYGAEDLVGVRRFSELLAMGSRIFHQTHWLPLLQLQRSVAEVQLELLHRDGRSLPGLVNATISDEAGETRHHIALFIVPDRRKYERELLDARRRAEEHLAGERKAQQVIDVLQRERENEAHQRALVAEQLIGIVSHDLRSPLNAIMLGATLLEDRADALDRRTVTRIISAGRRATGLIGDLLDFTQARLGGGLRVNPAEVALHDVVATALDELRVVWSARDIVHQRVGDGTARADPQRIGQLVTNLVGNALTYGDASSPVVVRSSIVENASEISVQNRGAPIPAALVPHLFEPLSRGDQVATGRSVGLGLFIVRQIAVTHGGEVAVSSTVDDGTCFTVTLPR